MKYGSKLYRKVVGYFNPKSLVLSSFRDTEFQTRIQLRSFCPYAALANCTSQRVRRVLQASRGHNWSPFVVEHALESSGLKAGGGARLRGGGGAGPGLSALGRGGSSRQRAV